MRCLAAILRSFGEVTVLHNNMEKSQIAPIRCTDRIVHDILLVVPASTTGFPMKYLGLPLALSKLKKIHVQHLLNKCRMRLAPWQGKMMTVAGRAALTKLVLTAQPIYHLTALKVPNGSLPVFTRSTR